MPTSNATATSDKPPLKGGASIYNADGTLEILVFAGDGALWRRKIIYLNPPFGTQHDLGGSFGNITACLDSEGKLAVFAIGMADKAVYVMGRRRPVTKCKVGATGRT